MAGVVGMYGAQSFSFSDQRAVSSQGQAPNIIIRELNVSHADFILENVDLRYGLFTIMLT